MALLSEIITLEPIPPSTALRICGFFRAKVQKDAHTGKTLTIASVWPILKNIAWEWGAVWGKKDSECLDVSVDCACWERCGACERTSDRYFKLWNQWCVDLRHLQMKLEPTCLCEFLPSAKPSRKANSFNFFPPQIQTSNLSCCQLKLNSFTVDLWNKKAQNSVLK